MPSDPVLLGSIQEEYPYMVSREAWGKKISGPALAAKNIKRLLVRQFPGVKFDISSKIYSGGASVYIYWNEFPDARIADDVDALTKKFQSRFSHGYDDSYEYDNDAYRSAFRELYGSASCVMTQPRNMSEADIAAHQAQVLQKGTPAPSASRRRRL